MCSARRARADESPRTGRRTVKAIHLLVLGQVLLVGCAGSMSGVPGASSGEASVRGVFDRDRVFRNAEPVLLANQIPVAEVDRFLYRVLSGPFLVGPVWGGAATEERVDCGTDSFGGPLARGGEIEMNVEVQVSTRRGVIGTQGSEGETVIRVVSSGQILWDDGGQGIMPRTASCRLTQTFARELLEQITSSPIGGPGGFGSSSGEPG